MNIVININKKYMKIAEVMLYSLLRNNKCTFSVYILTTDIYKDDLAHMLQILGAIGNVTIEIITIPNETRQMLTKAISARWPEQVYYRLYAPWLLPETIDRALYLDSDMIIDADISDLYNLDLTNFCFGACEDTVVSNRQKEDIAFYNRLGINRTEVYFNSGLILMNLVEIRKRWSMSCIAEILQSDKYTLIYPDQDVFNILASNNCRVINYRSYNVLCIFDRYSPKVMKEMLPGIKIFHFGGDKEHKPWETCYVGDYREIFWKYADKTDFGRTYQDYKKINNIQRLWSYPYFRFILPTKQKVKALIKSIIRKDGR